MIQPADETPLPGSLQPSAPRPEEQAVREIASDLTAARDEVSAAASTLADALLSRLDTSGEAAAAEAGKMAEAVTAQLAKPYAAVVVQAEKMAAGVADQLMTAETALWQAGIATPLTNVERSGDLADPTFNRFIARFPNDPAPVFDDCVPIDVSDDPVFVGILAGTVCAVGTHPQAFRCGNGSIRVECVPDEPPPSSFPPPSPPATVPPPPPATLPGETPPAVPPPSIPPPPVSPGQTTITACDPVANEPAKQIACFQLPPPAVEWKYWVAVDCADCQRPKACVFQGTQPPVSYVGVLLPRTWTTPPTQFELEALARECAVQFGGPAVSPPPSPPATSPPPSPAECAATATTLAEHLDGPKVDAACPRPMPDQVIDPDDVTNTLWSEINSCKSIHENAIKCMENPTVETCGSEAMITADGSAAAPSTWSAVGESLQWLVNPSVALTQLVVGESTLKKKEGYQELVSTAFSTAMDAVSSVLNGVLAKNVTNPKAAAKIGSLIAVNHRLEQVTGFPLSYLSTSLSYLYQFANPQFIPSQSELDVLYFANRISDSQWTCYTKANGNIPELFREVRDSRNVRPNTADLVQLFRRGEIKTEKELARRLRENGVTSTGHVQEFVRLQESVPQPPDIVRFMVRDVFDPNVVKEYDLDAEFEEKYTDRAKEMGYAAGISDETARFEWRSHWNVPSDTALYTMIQRLYPDRKEVELWDGLKDREGEAAAVRRFGPRPVTFTEADLRTALKINDNLPVFLDRLVAIQYRPITNTDAARMHELGLIGDEELADRIRQNGYTKQNADTIAKFYIGNKNRKLSNDTGVFTARKTIAAFKSGYIDREQADNILAEKILDPGLRARTLNDAVLEVKVETKQTAVKALKKRFMYGEFDGNDLARMLQQLDVEQLGIDATVNRWEAERRGRSKEPRAAMLCSWHDAGLITDADFYERLTRLGFTPDDAANISKLCSAQSKMKKAVAARREADRARADANRLRREEKEDLDGKITEAKRQLAALAAELDEARALVGY